MYCSSVHISLALWPSKSLQGKTMFHWKRLLLSGAVISFAETFCWKLFSTKIVFCFYSMFSISFLYFYFLFLFFVSISLLNQDCFLTIWHWSDKTILERNCPIMREKQLHWSDQFDHINEIFVPNFLFVRFIASSSSTQGRFYLGWQGHPKISQTESI